MAAWVFVSALALYSLTAGGSLTSSDAVVTFELTRSLVERGSIALSGNILGSEANRGLDGRYYSQFGIGHSLYNLPFYLAGRTAARAAGTRIGKADTIPKAAAAWGSAVAAAFTVAIICLLAFRTTGDPRAALLAAASVAVGSPLWPYSKFGVSTALTAAILASAACLLWDAAAGGRVRTAAGAGLVMAFGWLTRHEMAITLVPFAAFLYVAGARRGRASLAIRQSAAFLIIASAGGVLWMIYNAVRFGRPTFVGYQPAFGSEGYAAFLVSPARSVLLFCPIVVAWLVGAIRGRRESPGLLLLLAAPLLVQYVFFAALVDWAGGRSYGPRYLVPALLLLAPGFAVLVARRALLRRTAIALIVVAAVFQLPGVLVDYSKVSVDWARSVPREDVEQRNWHLSSSPIVLDTAAALRMIPANAGYLSGRLPFPRPATVAAEGDHSFAQRLSFSLDFWWLYLVYLRAIPVGAGLAAALALLGVSLWSATRAWRVATAIGTDGA